MARKPERAPDTIVGLLSSRTVVGVRRVNSTENPMVVAEENGQSFKVIPSSKLASGFAPYGVVHYNADISKVETVSLVKGMRELSVSSKGVTDTLNIEGSGYFVPGSIAIRDWDTLGRLTRVEVMYEMGAGNERDMAGFEYASGSEEDDPFLRLVTKSVFSKVKRSGLGLVINRDITDLPPRIDPGFHLGFDSDMDSLPIRYGTNSKLSLPVLWSRDIHPLVGEIWSQGGFEELARSKSSGRR